MQTPEPHELRAEVERHLDRNVRPFLTAHAGGVEVTHVDPAGGVDLTFVGACACCPMSGTTFYGAVEPAILAIQGVSHVNAPSNVNISRAAARRIAQLSRPRTHSEGLTP